MRRACTIAATAHCCRCPSSPNHAPLLLVSPNAPQPLPPHLKSSTECRGPTTRLRHGLLSPALVPTEILEFWVSFLWVLKPLPNVFTLWIFVVTFDVLRNFGIVNLLPSKFGSGFNKILVSFSTLNTFRLRVIPKN